jgi:hypothetical protein
MVKELGLLKIVVPDEFVAGGIIAKLPPSWRDFATALKHKRVHMSISDLIASLDVEEKAQAKDIRSKGADRMGLVWLLCITLMLKHTLV